MFFMMYLQSQSMWLCFQFPVVNKLFLIFQAETDCIFGDYLIKKVYDELCKTILL